MRRINFIFILIVISSILLNSEGLNLNNTLNNLYKLSNVKTRSISPENFTGEKGKGGMATLEEGNAAHAAREMGQGWKVNPFIYIKPGETFTLASIDTSGIINHIWMTPNGNYRLLILRFYWDGEKEPSVEVPVGDFFASGWGKNNEPQINSLAVCVNAKSGFNSYWQMPFKNKCKITLENMGEKKAALYYQIDYTQTKVNGEVAYFHAQFRRSNPVEHMTDHVIVDGIKGKGQYVGTYLARGANYYGWWGEGEVKFYIDGDEKFPTICGTGEEDYFGGSYCYEMKTNGQLGKGTYETFSTPYSGFYYVKDPYLRYNQERIGEYRWHTLDPIRFDKDLKVTIQSLGWKSGGRYQHLKDDISTVAYWYQKEPHNPFPDFPTKEDLLITYSKPVKHRAIGKKVVLKTEPVKKYNPGSEILIDGQVGSGNYRDGKWIGFESDNIEIVVDLGKKMKISQIGAGFLSSQNNAIFYPKKIEYLISNSGSKFESLALSKNKIKMKNSIEENIFKKEFNELVTRYVKIKTENITECPKWHKDSGDNILTFIDEIIVK